MSLLLHYDLLAKFEEIYFKDLLTTLHIVEHEKHIVKVLEKGFSHEPEEVPVNDYCTLLEKNDKKYMMPSKFVKKLPLKVVGTPKKYSLKGDVYYYLDAANVATAKFTPEKTMSFKELVNKLAGFEHSNQDHYRLLTLINITQMLGRANVRISTPPGFGKDSVVDIMGHLFGEAHTIENPTIAKLEMMTYAKLLAVNEVVDISSTQWRDIEQFLLATGAMKNQVTKRSRAHGGVGEILDVSHLSLTLMYNDITNYHHKTKYFDDITKKAVQDRFPPFRLHGHFIEDFNKISTINAKQYVESNLQRYIDIIRAFYYYKDNIFNELHYYEKPAVFEGHTPRWKSSIGRVLKIIDAYSDSREEFDYWCSVLDSSLRDYQEMLLFPGSLTLLAEKLRVPKEEFKQEPTLGFLRSVVRNRHRISGDPAHSSVIKFLDTLEKAETFVDKNIMVREFNVDKQSVGLDKW